MNCLDYQRVLNSDPTSRDPEFLRHRRECPHCAASTARAASFEPVIRDALAVETPSDLEARILLKQSFEAQPVDETKEDAFDEHLQAALAVSVPEDLAERIALRQSLREPRWKAFRHGWMYGLAATVLLCVGLVGGLLIPKDQSPFPQGSLENAVLAEILGEPEALARTDVVEASVVKNLVAPLGVELQGDLGPITHASLCAVRAKVAAHLVIKGTKAPVTLLLMPGQEVNARSPIEQDYLVGVLVPIRGGSMAIVGAGGEPLDRIEARVRSAVRMEI